MAGDPEPLRSRGDDRRSAEGPGSPNATANPIATTRAEAPTPADGTSPTIRITRPSFSSLGRLGNGNQTHRAFHKTVLRLDAFLGEWMSPTYFELITPPPGSVMMVAGAKAELLRKENYKDYPHFQDTPVPLTSSPRQLWGSASRSGLDDLSDLSSSLPTGDGAASNGATRPRKPSAAAVPDFDGYAPPIPTFAVSSNAPIPAGYVAHARDACVDIDYQWDSMRDPYDWGTGGEYGEEWTAMHKRFRKGIQRLVDWYSTTEGAAEMVTRSVKLHANNTKADSDSAIDDSDGEDVESVVILVTHGAGCNALIGAITHQPVLMDVAMASLTMAVRKPGKETVSPKSRVVLPVSSNPPRTLATPHPGIVAIHEYYDLKMFASTDHMRSVATTPMMSRHSSVVNVLAGARGRHANSLSSALGNFSYAEGGGSRSSSANAALAGARRSSGLASTPPKGGITVGSGVTSFRDTQVFGDVPGIQRTPSYGLWSPTMRDEADPFETDNDTELLLDFSHEKDAQAEAAQAEAIDSDDLVLRPDEEVPPVASPSVLEPPASPPPQLGLGTGGLWGSPRQPAEVARLRDLGSGKRRWTVNERS